MGYSSAIKRSKSPFNSGRLKPIRPVLKLLALPLTSMVLSKLSVLSLFIYNLSMNIVPSYLSMK